MISLTLAVVILLIWLKAVLYNYWYGTKWIMLAIYIPSILNACQATIFQLIYNEIAYRLTNLENH